MDMLEQLFGNNSRRKIVEFFIAHQREPFSFDDLKNNLSNELASRSLKKELETLSELGLLEAYWQNTADANGKDEEREIRFHINSAFPLLPELHSLILKSIIFWEQKLVKKIKSSGSICYLAFTGFFTDADHAPTDILIVGRASKKRLGGIMRRFQKDLHRPVRYTVLSKKEFKYRMDITDRFLYDILEGEKIVVVDEIHKS